MAREQIYVGSGAVTMLLNGNFYTIDKNAYYFKPNTEYEKGYYVIFDKKLYKVQKRTSQSPVENPDAYIEQIPVDNHTKVALNDDIDALQKQIDGSEEGTDHDLDEIKQKVDDLENDLNTNYLKIADFELKLSETEINASQIKGILDVGNIPQTAIPCLTVVNTVNDMYQLTTDDVQIGDVIKVQEDDKLYFVVDDTKLNSSEGYVEFNASVDWSTIINKPEEFKPQAHKHDLTDINDSETLALKSEVETKLDKEAYQQDQEKVVKYQEFTYNDTTRKTIQLNNYDSISGVGTDGHGYNIAMVSKWDKVDLGTASLTMNLNSKDGVVQINDDKTVATVDQIPSVDNLVTVETFNTNIETINQALDSKADKTVTDGLTENISTINNKFNDYALKSEIPDIPNDVYYLGNFSLSLTAENKAKEDGIYNNINYKVLTYTVNNSDNGFIINNVASDKTTQFLNYKGVQYKREVVNGEATPWVEMDTSIMLKGKAVNGIKLFKLTTDSTDTEIQEALSAGGSLITEDDLNACLTKGYTLREYSMQSPSIFVGFTGQGFTLSYFGFANPSQDSALMSIVIAINDGVYSVLKNATRALAITTSNIATNSTITSLTDRIQELESTCPKMVNIPIRTLKDEVYSKEDILSWFGVEDDPALKKIISGLAPMYLRYGILLSGNPHYYKMPIQYIAYETANQVKMVVVGLDTSNDVVSKYEIILNLDGTIIEGNSNVKVTITALE